MLCGIDPGLRGALAFFDPVAGTLDVVDMPTVEVIRGGKRKHEIVPQMVAAIIRARSPRQVVLEKVGAMPNQGLSSTFQFARGVGTIEGVVAGLSIPIAYVTPQVWQRDVRLRAGPDSSRARAAELFPAYAATFARVKDDGRADASLIAWWGAMTRA